jgi:hypothetical protein
MRWFVLVSLLISSFAFAGTQKKITRKPARKIASAPMPMLLSYHQLMMLPRPKRIDYITSVGKAISDFETATNIRLAGGRFADLEETPDSFVAYLAMLPEAEAASSDNVPPAPETWGQGWRAIKNANGTWSLIARATTPGATDVTKGTYPMSTFPNLSGRDGYYAIQNGFVSTGGVARHLKQASSIASAQSSPVPLAPYTPAAGNANNAGQPSGTNAPAPPITAQPSAVTKATADAKIAEVGQQFDDPNFARPLDHPPNSSKAETVAPISSNNVDESSTGLPPSVTGAPLATFTRPTAVPAKIDTSNLSDTPTADAKAATKTSEATDSKDTAKTASQKSSDPAASPADTACSTDEASLAQPRKDYYGTLNHDPSCLVGGRAGTYSGKGQFAAGTCRNADAEKICTDAGKKGLTACDDVFFCDPAQKELCVKRSQDVAKTCFEMAKNKKDGKLTDTCPGHDPQKWEQERQNIAKVCDRGDSAKKLFCFECSTLKSAIVAANKASGAPPDVFTTGAPAVPAIDAPTAKSNN